MKTRIKVLIASILGVILLMYFSVYFQKGIIHDNEFFRVTKENDISIFSGHLNGLEVTIRLNDKNNQIEYITNRSKKVFTIDYKERISGYYNVKLNENNKVLFVGQYDVNNAEQFKLYDEKGELYVSESQSFNQFDDKLINNSELIVYEIVISLALKDYNTVFRGQFFPFMIATIFIALFILDLLSPKMFYRFTTKFDSNYNKSDNLNLNHIIRIVLTLIIAISLLLLSIF